MSIKDVGIRFTPAQTPCVHCGETPLVGSTRQKGADQLWFTYCPACFRVHDQAAIPKRFALDIAANPGAVSSS